MNGIPYAISLIHPPAIGNGEIPSLSLWVSLPTTTSRSMTPTAFLAHSGEQYLSKSGPKRSDRPWSLKNLPQLSQLFTDIATQ